MKNSIKILAAIAVIGFAGNASAQGPTANANANATVVQPVSLSNNGTALSFGNVVAVANGSATMSDAPVGVETYTAGVDPGNLNRGTQSNVHFTVSGAAGFLWNIPAPPTTIPVISGANTLTVDNLTFSSIGGTLSGIGVADFYLGGTLELGATPVNGTYAGSVPVTVAYN